MDGCLTSILTPVFYAFYMMIVWPYKVFKSKVSRNAAQWAAVICFLSWVVVAVVYNELLKTLVAAIGVFLFVCCMIMAHYEEEIESVERKQKEEEEAEQMKQQLKAAGIDLDALFKFNVQLFSPNNQVRKAGYTDGEMENIEMEVENVVLGEKRMLVGEDKYQLTEIAEEVFRLWARREKEPDYVCTLDNYAKNPPKSYKVAEVVGVKYRELDARRRYDALLPGEKVLLVKETTNPYDENAVKVLSQDGFFMGYLAKDYAKKYRNFLNDVTYGWHFHYDEKFDLFNTVRIYRNYMGYEEERDTFEYGVDNS